MHLRQILQLIGISFLFTQCYKETFIESGQGLDDWSTTTHSSLANTDYETVFPQDQVNRFDITIDSDDWAIMQADLDDLYGSSSNTGSTGGGPPGNNGGGGGGGTTFAEETPLYVPCELSFNDKSWYYVGIRYKGNSSLSAASSGVNKLPFRLEFDQFEDDYPEITGQTFYGFPALSMSSNYNDQSFLREKVACDLFREFGVPAPETAFYEMWIDYGDGPVYFGLYTAVEVVFESMLNTQFGSENGNCYKPDGDGAAWANSNFNLADFENKTTGGTGGVEISEMFDILHSSTRTTAPATWRANLESVFDVDLFLKWMTVNTTIQNWDTYGRMTHNYYLYHDPADGLIKWIPWDNNEAFEEGKQGGALSFDFSEVSGEDWPLLAYLISDETYESRYKTYINAFIADIFDPSLMNSRYADLENIISASVQSETSDYSFLNSIIDFSTAITNLNTHASNRNSAAFDYAN